MKQSTWIIPSILMGLLLLPIYSCKKNDQPTPSNTVADIEGNVYHTVTIGSQVWMVENLKVSKYTDGTAIPLVTDNTAWGNLTTAGYCWYNNDAANKNIYGSLYNWYTINTFKLCPNGWHVPSVDDWATLTSFIAGTHAAGGKLKETGTTHWQSPNTAATDEYSFKALPGGWRDNNGGAFNLIGQDGYWWSTTYLSDPDMLYISYGSDQVTVTSRDFRAGLSIRCVKD